MVFPPPGWRPLLRPRLTERHPAAREGWVHEPTGATMGVSLIPDDDDPRERWQWHVLALGRADVVEGLTPEDPPFGWAERLTRP